jgi:hypothetical protein
MKRKEAGNYCAYFGHYYRDDPVCGDCPTGKCPKAQERYYEKLQKLLAKALSHSQAPAKEVKELLEHNELGLAYDAISAHEPTGACFGFLHEAKGLMDKGWM